MDSRRDMVAGERNPNLQPALHGKLKQGREKGSVEEREREGALQEWSWDNLFGSIWKKMDRVFCCRGTLSLSDFSPSPWPLPRVLLPSC